MTENKTETTNSRDTIKLGTDDVLAKLFSSLIDGLESEKEVR